MENPIAHTDVAYLGGGCFWCMEALYQEARGVARVESGYMGGQQPDPTYEQVATGASGHVEVVRLEFDPAVVSYRDLLEVFFTMHDPTTPNRQGNDVGPQYRSAIFTTSSTSSTWRARSPPRWRPSGTPPSSPRSALPRPGTRPRRITRIILNSIRTRVTAPSS